MSLVSKIKQELALVRKMHLEVLVSDFEGSIEELVRAYSPLFRSYNLGRVGYQNWGLVLEAKEGFYLITISNRNISLNNSNYNVIITAQGPFPRVVKDILQDFKNKTRMVTKAAPDHLLKRLKLLEKSYPKNYV